MNQIDLKGRVAVITGGAQGIGYAISERMLRSGARVVMWDIDGSKIAQACQTLSALGAVSGQVVELTDDAAVAAVTQATVKEAGAIDILVNNAGITKDGLLMRMSDADFDDVLNVNLRSVFIACRAAARPMLRGKFGRVVNIGSVSGVEGNKGQANYAAAKAGLIGLTKSVAKELGSKGVTANVVAPGFVETDMTAFLGPDDKKKVSEHITVGRLGVPEDIAAAVGYLTADDAGYITGQVLVVDGGLPM